MQNSEIAAHFSDLADLLELEQANAFRIRAYRKAVRTIENATEPLAEIAAEDPSQLQRLDGIGKDLAEKISELVSTGRLSALVTLQEKIPPDVVRMLRIPGLGPKKVAALFHDLGLDSLENVRQAALDGKIAALKGFGKKTEQVILDGLDRLAQFGTRIYLADAKPLVDQLVRELLELDSVTSAAVAGSVRRLKETIGDLDIVVCSDNPAEPMDFLAAHKHVESVLARGETKQRVRLHPFSTGFTPDGTRLQPELDLRVVPEESFGAALQYFTGSKEHNIVMRRLAQQSGYKLNEYGLFENDKQVAGAAEAEIYQRLRLPWIPPELREDRGEFAETDVDRVFPLLEISDIRGDLHMHTTATDGTATLEQMIEAARERGREYIAITDHSQRVTMANGLNAERLRAQWAEIREIRTRYDDIDVLCGIECDILEDATLDLPDDVLAEADWVIAVLHYGLNQPAAQIHQRLLTAIENPYVHAIGHLTGRMLGRREGAAVDFEDVFAAAAEHGVMLEINAHPARLDLDDLRAAQAKAAGIPIVINTDAHSPGGMERLEWGIYQARRAGLTADDVANTRPIDEFRNLLRR